MHGSGADTGHVSVRRFFELAECGIIAPDERVELLDGLVVAMVPPSPPHDYAVQRVQYALLRRLGLEVVTRVQSTFLAGDASVLQPDVAVVPGEADEYLEQHPRRAHLIVEVAHSSVSQDRLTKAALYARAGVPCYWVVNLRDVCVESFRKPDRQKACYGEVSTARGRDVLRIDAFADVTFEAADLLPPVA